MARVDVGAGVRDGKLFRSPVLCFCCQRQKQVQAKGAELGAAPCGVGFPEMILFFVCCLFAVLTLGPSLTDFCFSKKSHVTTDINCAFFGAM